MHIMQGTSRQISERRPQIRNNPLRIIKTKPANSPSNFVHETPRAHFASDAASFAAAPLYVSMVRTYIRKGGHGGDRSKAGLPAGYCGRRRVVAPQQPQQRLQQKRKNCQRKRQQRRRPPTAGSSGPSTVMSSSRPAISCKQRNARLVRLD